MIVLLPVAFVILFIAWKWVSSKSSSKTSKESPKPDHWKIQAVPPEFDWATEEPKKHRPFKKGPWAMTMGVRRIENEEWLLIDKNYKSTVATRAQVAEDDPKETIFASEDPGVRDCVAELYEFVIDYYVQRFPQYFKVKDGNIHNLILGNVYPQLAGNQTAKEMLKILNANGEEDLFILTMDPESEEYALRAGCVTFPAGVFFARKMNEPLSSMHVRVPYYQEKLHNPMNKFFGRIKPYVVSMRRNWTLQSNGKLYDPSGEGAKEATHVLQPGDDMSDVHLRVERQCLIRLPRTNQVVFTIRSHLTPLEVIKSEGLGDDLASAIENLPLTMGLYKGREAWGDAAVDYLRTIEV